MYKQNYNYRQIPYNNTRFIGPNFAVPFLLGGITGGLLAPNFYPRPPIYGPPIPPPPPYPYYY